MQRTIAANIIQRSWRRFRAVRKAKKNVLKEIKEDRSKKLISHWLRDLKFRHRMKLNRTHSFLKSITKESELYIHLDVYMNLPRITNVLQYSLKKFSTDENCDLYKVLHQKS